MSWKVNLTSTLVPNATMVPAPSMLTPHPGCWCWGPGRVGGGHCREQTPYQHECFLSTHSYVVHPSRLEPNNCSGGTGVCNFRFQRAKPAAFWGVLQASGKVPGLHVHRIGPVKSAGLLTRTPASSLKKRRVSEVRWHSTLG